MKIITKPATNDEELAEIISKIVDEKLANAEEVVVCSKFYGDTPNIKQRTRRASPSRTSTANLARSTESAALPECRENQNRSRGGRDAKAPEKGSKKVFPTEEAVAQAMDVRAQGSTATLSSLPQRYAEVWRETKMATETQRRSTSNTIMSSRTIYGVLTQVIRATKTTLEESVGRCRV